MQKLTVFLSLLAVSLVGSLKDDEHAEWDVWGDGKTSSTTIVGLNVSIPFPPMATYRRVVWNAKGKEEEHLYRVCNGKNKKICGFWENVKTKKKVPSGPTTYNKKNKKLVIKNIRATDQATYYTGNKKKKFEVFVMNF
ncbi:hypothetical protein CAEBREN_10597 [Caenorhabditis brenneri]|uniref:Uncharacterized protein n=1 Tax=Caenorhabditis brenneri TaxID=135651 RepID=G0P3W4_CAEBE|nr:hypothetical protein CAEBREN_10597 [Caenorhabditis brenneri]